MQPTSPLPFQPYDLLKGMEFVAVWIMLVFVIALAFGFRAQYRLMNKYDGAHPSDPRYSQSEFTLRYIKQVIFAALGYQGEERERQSLDSLTEGWIQTNFFKIFFRFAIFYFVYIWALILTTRAIFFDPVTSDIHFLSYTSKQLFGFGMIGLYIASNSLFDILSIFFTVRNLIRIQERPTLNSAAFYLGKNILYCFAFFILSQMFSNLIWPLKVGLQIPLFERLFSPAIALWPYAFIIDASTSPPEYLHLLFPGQILITGTVFLPTLVAVLLFAASAVMLRISQPLKRFIIAEDLTMLGIVVTPAPGQKPTYQFRCLNGLTIGIVSGLIATAIWEWLKIVISFV
ncbi:MAG: hypothetical protein ACTHLO_06580 [Pseudolabrys sp.]